MTYYLRGVEDNSVFEAELRSRINAAAATAATATSLHCTSGLSLFLTAAGGKERKPL